VCWWKNFPRTVPLNCVPLLEYLLPHPILGWFRFQDLDRGILIERMSASWPNRREWELAAEVWQVGQLKRQFAFVPVSALASSWEGRLVNRDTTTVSQMERIGYKF
jgi:hypothetical protein